MNKELRKEYFDKAFRLHSAGNFVEAQHFYRKILKENPDDYEVLNLSGVAEIQQENFAQAEELVKKAISIKEVRYFYETLSKIYSKQKLYAKEIEVLLEEERLFGLNYELAFNLGMAYKNSLDFEKSEYYYKKATELTTNAHDVNFNLGNLYTFFHFPEKAKESYLNCLKISPNDREAMYFLALNYFRLKDYASGLPCFETRLCRETAINTEYNTYPNLIFEENIWHGEDISDKTLYTYYEAGYGDMIMFARYIPLLKQRCKKLVIKPQVALCQLFRENFPDVEVMEYFTPEKDFKFDLHIPFLSVPYVLGLKGDDMFINRKQYLSADKNKVAQFKEKFFNNDKFKIGIKWQGNTYYETDRVINVDAFAGLFDLKNVQVYSAQTFEGAEEFQKLSDKYDIIDLSKSFNNFSDTAATIENLDLVICNDTSLAHLAGAMNKPCSILLPYNYNWRWHTDLTHCDWYESVKLYLADKDESWTSVMNRVISDINF